MPSIPQPQEKQSQKSQSRKNRSTNKSSLQLSDSLTRQLNTYAQAATAAGVAVLALAACSEAKVVYTQTYQVTQTGFPLSIDLNHDGIKDFQLRTSFYEGTGGLQIALNASGYRNASNVVAGQRVDLGSGYFLSEASALRDGAEIGPGGNFSLRFPFLAEENFAKNAGSQYSDLGAWAGPKAGKNKDKGVKNRYLGLKFVIDGEVHYGWARLTVTLGHRRQFDDVSGTLTGYAYETTPNQAIAAGDTTGADVITEQPTTLGGLALGRE